MIDDKGKQVKEAPPSLPGRSARPDHGAVGRRPVHGGRERRPRPRSRRLSPRRARQEAHHLGAGQSRESVRHQVEHDDRIPDPRSRPTSRARPKRSSTPSTASRPTRSRSACSMPASARSPRATSPWPGLRRRRSSASTSAPTPRRARSPTRHGVELRYYDVIYHLTDWVKQAMAGELGPEIIETVVGRAEVREVFSAGKHGKAAGLLVTEGIIRKALRRASRARTSSPTPARSLRCAASRTMSPRSRRAWSAA